MCTATSVNLVSVYFSSPAVLRLASIRHRPSVALHSRALDYLSNPLRSYQPQACHADPRLVVLPPALGTHCSCPWFQDPTAQQRRSRRTTLLRRCCRRGHSKQMIKLLRPCDARSKTNAVMYGTSTYYTCIKSHCTDEYLLNNPLCTD